MSRAMKRRSAIALLSLTALSACAVGPNYHPPVVQADARQPFMESHGSTMLSGQPLPANWWEMFQDPALDRLIQDAFAYNTDIRQAVGNLRRARGALSEAQAARLPSPSLSGGYTR